MQWHYPPSVDKHNIDVLLTPRSYFAHFGTSSVADVQYLNSPVRQQREARARAAKVLARGKRAVVEKDASARFRARRRTGADDEGMHLDRVEEAGLSIFEKLKLRKERKAASEKEVRGVGSRGASGPMRGARI